MALQSDTQGFITGGTPVTDIRRTTDLLSAIRSDVLAIKNAVVRGVNRTASQQNNASVIPFPAQRTRQTVVAATPNRRESTNTPSRARDESGSYASRHATTPSRERTVSQPQTGTVALNAIPATDVAATSNRAVVTPSRSRRDALGRFSSSTVSASAERANATRDRAGRFSSNADDDSTGSRQSESSMLGRFADRIATSVTTLNAGGLENVDPTVMAAQEISQVATPLVRGFQVLTGGDKGDGKWFRKILSVLTLTRRESSVFQRTANRRLVNIDNNTEDDGSGGGDGSQSFIGGLLGSVYPWIMTAMAGIGTALVGGIGAVLGVIFSPIGLAIGAAAAIAWGLFTENGQKFFGEVGAKIIAGWEFVTAAFAPLSESISAAWTVVTAQFEPIATSIGESWDSVKGGFDSLIDGMVSSWNAFTGFLKDKFGIDIPAIFKPIVDVGKKVIDKVKSGVETVKDVSKSVANKAIDKAKSFGEKANSFIKDKTGVDVKQSASNAISKVQDGISNVSGKVVEGATKIASHALGKTSQMFESGSGGAGTVSSGKGDHGGASYGTYQLSSSQGTLQKFLKSTPFGQQFKSMQPGSKEFNKKWKSVAESEPDFGSAQHEFIKKTHFDPQMEKLKKSGIDLSDRGSAVKDSVWSTAVQFGGGTSLIKKALKDKDASKLSDKDIVSAIQDYKIANNDNLFSKSSDNVRKGTLNRAINEKHQLSKLATAESSIISPIQLASVKSIPSPSLPEMPKAAPSIAEATPVMAPSSSSNDRQNISVTVDRGDAGRDVEDRRLAHIITGGLSS